MDGRASEEGRGEDVRSAPHGDDRREGTTGPRIEGYDPVLFTSFGFEHDRGLDTHLGLVVDLVSPDRVEAHLDVDAIHLTPYGDVHGGVHTAIVEAVGSLASVARVIADGNAAVGTSNSTDFLRPVREGRLHAVGTPIFVGRTQHLWLVEITDDRGRLAARGQLRTAVIDRPA